MFIFDNLDFLWSLGVGAFITIFFVLYISYRLKKQDPLKAPIGALLVAEVYVTGFNNMFDNMMNGKLKGAQTYFFALFNYIFILSILPVFSFPALPANLLFTVTISLISFMGIFVVGIFTNGLWKFIKEKYSNPIELFTQFAPFISLSVRLFAASLASAFIGETLFIIINALTEDVDWLNAWPLMSSFWSWGWSFISSMLALIQTFVFVALTAVYWTESFGVGWSKKSKKEYKEELKTKKMANLEK